VHCPAFPENLMAAFYPYKNGEVKKFKNQDDDTLLLYINEVWKTEKHTYDTRYDGGCAQNGGVSGYLKNNNDSISVTSSISLATMSYSMRFVPESHVWSLYFGGEFPEEIDLKDLNKVERYFPDIIEMEFREWYNVPPSYYVEHLTVKRAKIEKYKGITEILLRDTIWTLVE
jgi:hypothetical protein